MRTTETTSDVYWTAVAFTTPVCTTAPTPRHSDAACRRDTTHIRKELASEVDGHRSPGAIRRRAGATQWAITLSAA